MPNHAALLANAYPVRANGRAQLLPAGNFAARDGRPGPGKSWRLSDAGGHALAARLNAIAGATPISIDYEHQTFLAATNGQPAPAAGWIEHTDWTPGEGLFARVKWTPRGQALIDADEYRYISPVILYADDGTVTGLHNAALVSVPAIVGMDAVTAALAAQFAHPRTNHTEEPPVDLTQLITLLGLTVGASVQDATARITALAALATFVPQMAQALGLPAAASQADINARITALAARPALPAQLVSALGLQAGADEVAALSAVQRLRTSDATTVATITALQGEVAALSARISTDEVTRTVDEAVAAHKLLPAQRDWAIGLGKANMAQLSAYLASAPVIPGLSGQANGKGNEGGSENTADAAEIARQAVTYQTAQLAAGLNVSTQQAVSHVMAMAAKA